MTRRERILRSIAHEVLDRIPTVIDARREVQESLKRYYHVDNYCAVLEILDAEEMYHFKTDGMLKILFPDFEEKAIVLDGPWLGGGQKYIQIDEATFQDGWGVIRRIGRDGKFIEWVTGPLVGVDDPDDYDFPGPSRIIEDPSLVDKVSAWKKQDLFVRAIVSQPFKTAWLLRGMENLLMDYLLHPSFVEKLYEKIYSLYGEILYRCAEAQVDVIGFDGDVATQTSVIMGPHQWRIVDKPRLAQVIQRCKKVNPLVNVFFHSDGNIMEILPDLIEIGFNIIDPIQPECMNTTEIKKRFGDQITMHRCGSLQRTLPFGTPAECRHEAIELIEKCGYNGGLVLGASNTISFDVPVENIVAWYEAVRDYHH